jgi:hypothetical protein
MNRKAEGPRMTHDEETQVSNSDTEMRLMNMYLESAKSFTKLSVAALVLPIVYLRAVRGEAQPISSIPGPMIASWLLFLLSIGSGLLYELLAAKYVENQIDGWPTYNRRTIAGRWREIIDQNPGYVYDIMLGTFYIAAVSFVIGALDTVKHSLLWSYFVLPSSICVVLFVIYFFMKDVEA